MVLINNVIFLSLFSMKGCAKTQRARHTYPSLPPWFLKYTLIRILTHLVVHFTMTGGLPSEAFTYSQVGYADPRRFSPGCHVTVGTLLTPGSVPRNHEKAEESVVGISLGWGSNGTNMDTLSTEQSGHLYLNSATVGSRALEWQKTLLLPH